MFAHVFKYRLLCILRDKETIFWSALFPILLATLFGIAFGNLGSVEMFQQIPIAVIDNASYRQDVSFQSALNSASESGLLDITISSSQDADMLVSSGEAVSVMQIDDDGHIDVLVSSSGVRQSIVKAFADTYMQTRSVYSEIAAQNPEAVMRLSEAGSVEEAFITHVPLGRSFPDNMAVYYFALIAMACLYGGYQGLNAINAVQANQSDIAARSSLVPVKKFTLTGASLGAAMTVHFASVLLLLTYMWLVIGIDFGDRFALVVLSCAAGSVMGVTFGAAIGGLIKRNEGFKSAILTGCTLTFAFLAGLMAADMKYFVSKSLPVLSYINPANLVADAFYSLYYYDTLSRYFFNLILMAVFTTVFFTIIFAVMRRQKYASL